MSTSSETRIQLLKTAFVVYYHADLDKAKHFLLDFGLSIASEKPGQEISFKGYGTEPYVYVARKAATSHFGGAAYVVESRKELDKCWWRSVGLLDGSFRPSCPSHLGMGRKAQGTNRVGETGREL